MSTHAHSTLAAHHPPDDDGGMHIGPTEILDEHAEAFTARYARLIVTAADAHWLDATVRAATGYAASVIGCDVEAGVERLLSPAETPDGRPGAALLFFAFTTERLGDSVAGRVGQCVLTCPTTACYDGLAGASETIPLGAWIHAFGDGHEALNPIADCGLRNADLKTDNPKSEIRNPKSLLRWHIPVMDGEFVVDDVAGVAPGIAGGNLVLHARDQSSGLAAALRAAGALADFPGVITPFPGGVCRSGSKVGARQAGLVASTDEAYCPTLRDTLAAQNIESRLVAGATCAYEIVVDGVDLAAVRGAMRVAIEAAAGPGLLAIGAREFGGKLGKHRVGLRELFAEA